MNEMVSLNPNSRPPLGGSSPVASLGSVLLEKLELRGSFSQARILFSVSLAFSALGSGNLESRKFRIRICILFSFG